jgi:hypothetical protein
MRLSNDALCDELEKLAEISLLENRSEWRTFSDAAKRLRRMDSVLQEILHEIQMFAPELRISYDDLEQKCKDCLL